MLKLIKPSKEYYLQYKEQKKKPDYQLKDIGLVNIAVEVPRENISNGRNY